MRPGGRVSVAGEHRRKACLVPITDEEAQRPSEYQVRTANTKDTLALEVPSEDCGPNPGPYAINQLTQRSQSMIIAVDSSSMRSWDPTTAEVPDESGLLTDDTPESRFMDENPIGTSTSGHHVLEADASLSTIQEENQAWMGWHVIVGIVVLLIGVVAVGLGGFYVKQAKTSKSGRNVANDQQQQATLVPTGKCDFEAAPDQSPVLQCFCRSKISDMSEKISTLYHILRSSQRLSDYNGPADRCHPENTALWWTAMTDDFPTDNILDSASQETKVTRQRYGLALLYLSLEGWADSTEWLGDGSECDWQGISCDELLHVSGINLSGRGLKGELPITMFRHLPALTDLVLFNNELEGRFPVELLTLARLKQLDFSTNKFIGTIPYVILYLSELTSLKLDRNKFTGSIPDSLYMLTGLIELNLSGNTISGVLSESIGNLGQLKTLILENNTLSGTLPSSLGNLSALEILNVGVNELTGSIPSELARLSNSLKELVATYNSFEGTSLPAFLGTLTALTTLSMARNRFMGAIPPQLATLSQLDSLNLSANVLTGTIPSYLETWKNIELLDLSQNEQMSGTVPEKLCNIRDVYFPCPFECPCCDENQWCDDK
jgi:Leucine-rich repeat (LRR) protein